MNEFFAILVSLLTQPWSLVLWVLFIGWIIVGVWRYERFASVLIDLGQTAPGKRRYKLERQYKIYPGSDNKPMAYVRRLRARWILTVAGVCVAMVAGLLGVAAEHTFRSEEAVLTMEVLSVSPLRFGYAWTIRLENTGTEMTEVQSVRVVVESRKEHPEKNLPRPEYPEYSTGHRLLRVNPQSAEVPVVSAAGEITMGPGSVRTISFELEAEHKPHEGWIYEVAPEVIWNLAGSSRPRTERGQTYRLGWPGLPHWSEPGATGGDVTQAVVDDLEIISRE